MDKEQKKLLHRLYVELVRFQKEVIASGQQVLVVIEGRDAAGKDGLIKRIVKHLSPRETRVVALGKPSDREISEWYFQRFSRHLPARGEFVLFNRSWYNRAGVEKVMRFCTDAQYRRFFGEVARFEGLLSDSGITILKYYLDISRREQGLRLADRKKDPLKQWKLSPIDREAQRAWKAYSRARNRMLGETDFPYAPWFVADAEDKNEMHIAVITHLLKQVRYRNKNHRLLRSGAGHVYAASSRHTMRKRLYP